MRHVFTLSSHCPKRASNLYLLNYIIPFLNDDRANADYEKKETPQSVRASFFLYISVDIYFCKTVDILNVLQFLDV